MPEIAYEAARFPWVVPTWAPKGPRSNPAAHVTRAALVAHAATVGDISVLTGSPTRRALDVRWRAAAVSACLATSNDRWVRAPQVEHLDSSEKGFMGYLLGMTQASVMAEHILGVLALVHVDAVLRLFGTLEKEKRPDLIGYMKPHLGPAFSGPPPPARILVEAKGTTGGRKNKTIAEARAQIKPAYGTPANANLQQLAGLLGPNPLRVISYAYFDKNQKGTKHPIWKSYLEDPPREHVLESEWSDDEYRGLIIAAKLLPVFEDIRELPVARLRWPDEIGVEMRSVQLEDGGIAGFPDPLARVFEDRPKRALTPASSPSVVEELRHFCSRVSEAVPEPAKLLSTDGVRLDGWEIGKMRTGFAVALRS